MYFSGQDDDGITYAVPGSDYHVSGIKRMWYQFDTGLFYFVFDHPVGRVPIALTPDYIMTNLQNDALFLGLSLEGIGKIQQWVKEVDKSIGTQQDGTM